MNPMLPPLHQTTLENFKRDAVFVRYSDQRRLRVLYGVSVYFVKEQRYGKLTASRDQVLESIFKAYSR